MLKVATISLVCIAGVVVAHEGVLNPVVMARMDLMSDIGKNTETLGKMAKGDIPFSAGQAVDARASLLRHLSEVPDRFEDNAQDPKSEALPAIWNDWKTFLSSNQAAQNAVEMLDTQSLDSLRAGIGPMARSCTACHERFRQD